MLLTIDLTSGSPIPREIDLSKHRQAFLFDHLFHREHRESQLQRKSKSEHIRQADFSAAVAAKIISQTRSEELVIQALHCCRDILLSHGFKETTEDGHAAKTLEFEGSRVVFVAGCQTEAVLESRIQRALELILELGHKVDLAFAGGAPEGEVPLIPQESGRMCSIYSDMIRGRYRDRDFSGVRKFIDASDVFEEESSKTTKENMQRFAAEYFRSCDTSPKILYVVSSTFHLLRLAHECLDMLDSHSDKHHVSKLVLCGADAINKPDAHVFEERYLKLMMFDVYRHLLSS